jgi:hypothetical protein
MDGTRSNRLGALWPDQGDQGCLILGIGIERGQSFGLGSAEKTLVGGDQNEIVTSTR